MLHFETYEEHEKHLPAVGKFIIAQFDKESIIVYQAFKDTIAAFAVDNQKFGGKDYDFDRQTWLKPSFLWMMYYSGWARNENQENVLAIRLSRQGFDQILHNAVLPSSRETGGGKTGDRGRELAGADIQLQWEIYHDLLGEKTDRRAAKIGIKGKIREQFNNEWILGIENITPFVKEQQRLVKSGHTAQVQLPRERAYAPDDLTILRKIDATTISL